MFKKHGRAIILTAVILTGISILRFQNYSDTHEIGVDLPVVDSTLLKLKNDVIRFEQIFKSGVEGCKCPGSAIVVVKDSSVILMKGFGTKKVRTNDPVDENTVFRLGSVSKGFASVTAGMLVEKGYFDWDDKVKDYYPGFELISEEQGTRIKISHILSHTSGLIRHAYTNLIEEGWSIEEITPLLKEVELVGREGENFAYQNVMYSLIEKVASQATNRKYPEILQQEIFDKCGMDYSTCTYEGLKKAENKSMPHLLVANNYIYAKTKITRKYYNSVSSGGVNASVSDMGKWLMLLLGNRPDIISSETLESIFEPVISTRHERRFYDRWQECTGSYYAMGWRVLDFNNRRIIYHGGYVNGYRSEIAFDRENKVGVCALFNTPCKYANSVIRDFFNFYDNTILPGNILAQKTD